MNENIIYFDESGHTGPDLLNIDQPIFLLSSVNISEDQCEKICKTYLNDSNANELHFIQMKKYKKYHHKLIQFLDDSFFSYTNVKCFFIHKEYMIIAKFLDLFIEPEMFKDGIDYYDGGTNIAYANMHYFCLPGFCGQGRVKQFYKFFIKMIQQKTRSSIIKFFKSFDDIISNCSDKKYKEELITFQYIIKKNIIQDLALIDKWDIEPAIPAFITLTSFWNDELRKPFKIIHDESKPLKKNKRLIEVLMDKTASRMKVGYGKEKYTLPLDVISLDFADSKIKKQLQIADIIAGIFTYWIKGVYNKNNKKELWNLLNPKIKSKHYILQGIYPSREVGVYENRIKQIGDINPLDYTMFLLDKNKMK